jgi:hypothetical protein
MTNKELDSMIDEDVTFLREEERLELRVDELEKAVERMQITELAHQRMRKRWGQMLALIGLDDTHINPTTFEVFNQAELLDDEMMSHSVREITRLTRLGSDFEFILKGIQANETTAAQWQNLLMTMKLYHEGNNEKA